MKSRPEHIYVILGKLSDGTILNESECNQLQNYISELEKKQ